MQQIMHLFEGYLRIYVNCPDEASDGMAGSAKIAANREKDPRSVQPRFSRCSSGLGLSIGTVLEAMPSKPKRPGWI
jgi:hypothetical protein